MGNLDPSCKDPEFWEAPHITMLHDATDYSVLQVASASPEEHKKELAAVLRWTGASSENRYIWVVPQITFPFGAPEY